MTTQWESWPGRDRRHSFRAAVDPPLTAELFTESRHFVVELRNLSESGCLACWSAREPALAADSACELAIHFPGSKKRHPRVEASVRHCVSSGDLHCAGLELHFRPKVVFGALARELRRVWIEAQRRDLRKKRGE